MLYILSVELIAACQSKLLHLDVIYLPCKGRKRFREKLPWFGESKRTPSGYWVAEFQHKLAYTGKCKLCLLYGRFKPRSSSGTDVTPQRCDMSMLWMRGGMWRSRALFRIAVSGVRRNTYTPVPVGKLRLYGSACSQCTPHLRRTALRIPHLFRTGSNILPSLHNLSNPPSHTSTVGISGRTPLEFGG